MKLLPLIKSLKFDYVNSLITAENFPYDGRNGKVELVNFGRYIRTEDALKELKNKENELLSLSEPELSSEETLECIKILNETIEKLRWFQAELAIMQREEYEQEMRTIQLRNILEEYHENKKQNNY